MMSTQNLEFFLINFYQKNIIFLCQKFTDTVTGLGERREKKKNPEGDDDKNKKGKGGKKGKK